MSQFNPVPDPVPPFNPAAAHQQKPKLRPVRVFPAEIEGNTLMGIADARQISPKVVVTHPAAQFVLPLMDGLKGLDEIVKTAARGLTLDILKQLVAQLDDAGLLAGPTADAMLARVHAEFDSQEVLPPGSTAQVADALAMQAAGSQEVFNAMPLEERDALGAKKLGELLDDWIAQSLKDAPNPSLDVLPKAIVAPHLDYPRGWINYGSVYGRLRVVDRPDRVIILGTNHFGESTGVCGCDKGYESPLGTCELDDDLVGTLRRKLGDANATKLFANRFDHEREHSIELQVPWVQHVFGRDSNGKFPKIFGALVHDPTVNNGESYDGNGLAFEPFVAALRETLATLPGKTLIISSADMSHVGPAFGDNVQLAGDGPEVAENRNNVFRSDRDMITMLTERKPDELIAAMSWQGNPTRWCSVGNLVATMKLVNPEKVELLNFSGAMDEQGQALVTSAAMVMT
jgi:AmmeMemoRadiSam system protein B